MCLFVDSLFCKLEYNEKTKMILNFRLNFLPLKVQNCYSSIFSLNLLVLIYIQQNLKFPIYFRQRGKVLCILHVHVKVTLEENQVKQAFKNLSHLYSKSRGPKKKNFAWFCT